LQRPADDQIRASDWKLTGDMMAIAWIARNAEGIIRAFCDVSYADPETLDEFSENGKTVELIEAERIILNRPLPPDAKILLTRT